MKLSIIILFQIISFNLFGQNNVHYQLTNDSDTLYYYHYEKPIIEKLNLIKPEENINFFRFSSDKYYLELSNHLNKYILYADEVWEGKKTGEVFIKVIDLDLEQINEIKGLIDSLKIKEIPSSNKIKNWTSGFDGSTYKFEIKDGNTYSFKHYWTPSSQNKFEESNTINSFIKEIDRIIKYEKNGEIFMKEIPFFSWTKDGVSWNAVTIITKENYSEYKKLKRKQSKRKQ